MPSSAGQDGFFCFVFWSSDLVTCLEYAACIKTMATTEKMSDVVEAALRSQIQEQLQQMDVLYARCATADRTVADLVG